MTKKWEYATVPLLVHATKQILDTWGEDGWELVQVVSRAPKYVQEQSGSNIVLAPENVEQLVAYLKREKQ
jgi:hypothetical protein